MILYSLNTVFEGPFSIYSSGAYEAYSWDGSKRYVVREVNSKEEGYEIVEEAVIENVERQENRDSANL